MLALQTNAQNNGAVLLRATAPRTRAQRAAEGDSGAAGLH
jgi:hypothetical protein